jgi:acetyl-CoA C-acetyltransferase
MSELQEVLIVGAVRTAIGDFGGTLKDFAPSELGSKVIAEAIRRSGLKADDVQHVVLGNVIQSEPKDAYIARVAAVKAGVPIAAPAVTVNRLCGSGVQAIISAAQMMMLGEANVTVAGGAESMSQAPYTTKSMRWGQKMGNVAMLDALLETLNDPFDGIHMGITAENVAKKYNIDREMQDALAAEGHKRGARAIAEGRFKDQILPIEIKTRKGVTVFDTDEHVRVDTTVESLGALRPAFAKEGSVTAGNASGINDGAAAVVLATRAVAEANGLTPLARVVAWGHAGVDPAYMGIGPVKAVPIALERAGLTLDQIDVIEANEAFAAQACAVAQELGFDPEKLNPNGSGIALGHPVGATGAILTVKAVYELQRTGGRYALITMCIGGGQGIAMILERM